MMAERLELLPCPFCGSVSPNLLYGYDFVEGYKDARRVYCGLCGAKGPVGEGKAEAAEKWNNRNLDGRLEQRIRCSKSKSNQLEDVCAFCMDCVE